MHESQLVKWIEHDLQGIVQLMHALLILRYPELHAHVATFKLIFTSMQEVQLDVFKEQFLHGLKH